MLCLENIRLLLAYWNSGMNSFTFDTFGWTVYHKASTEMDGRQYVCEDVSINVNWNGIDCRKCRIFFLVFSFARSYGSLDAYDTMNNGWKSYHKHHTKKKRKNWNWKPSEEWVFCWKMYEPRAAFPQFPSECVESKYRVQFMFCRKCVNTQCWWREHINRRIVLFIKLMCQWMTQCYEVRVTFDNHVIFGSRRLRCASLISFWRNCVRVINSKTVVGELRCWWRNQNKHNAWLWTKNGLNEFVWKRGNFFMFSSFYFNFKSS